MLAIGLGTGAVFAAAAASVMGALEEAKAGVGSAMNDVSQMLAGALSIAAVGSIMYAIYRARLGNALDALPQGVADAARDSIGAAMEAAALLPPEEGLALSTAARTAFTDAFGISVALGAGLSLIGGLLIARFMPATQASGHGAHGRGHGAGRETEEAHISPATSDHPDGHPTGQVHATGD